MFTLYQRGRGQEPVTVAGRIRSLVAVNAMSVSFQTIGCCLVSIWVLQDSIAFFAECELFTWLMTTGELRQKFCYPGGG
jgi:hypothetical protein